MAVLQRHKSNIYGLQADLNKIGDLSLLSTTQKDDLVSAINELDGELDTTLLTTTNKTIVGAINELDSEIGDITTKAVTLTASDLIGLINELEGKKVSKSANLSDLADTAVSRTNLDVYSKSEVSSAINQASLNLGTNFTALDVADANTKFLAGSLSVGDNIFIKDDTDTKWAIYKVIEITDGSYSTSTLEKIMDEDVYLNAQSASAIKSAYESNADTNAFTDSDKTKVDFVSITKAVDLDKAILSDALYIDATFASATSDITAPSSSAVKTYVDSAVAGGGAIFKTETVTVVDDKITLTNEPKNGVIFNFGTVRHVDVNFISYDIPVTVTATAGNKEFLLSPDSSGQFDGKSVTVQYAYVPII